MHPFPKMYPDLHVAFRFMMELFVYATTPTRFTFLFLAGRYDLSRSSPCNILYLSLAKIPGRVMSFNNRPLSLWRAIEKFFSHSTLAGKAPKTQPLPGGGKLFYQGIAPFFNYLLKNKSSSSSARAHLFWTYLRNTSCFVLEGDFLPLHSR